MRSLAALLLCSVSTAAFAISEPAPTTKDEHVRTVAYDPANRVRLVIQQGMVTNITFQPMEMIAHVVKTDLAPFDYPKKQADTEQAEYINNLPIIGKAPGDGNLVVITRGAPPNDQEHPYNISIHTIAASADDREVTFQLTFIYPAQYQVHAPADPDAPKKLTWKEKKAMEDADLAVARARSDVGYGPKNDNYKVQGRAVALAPVKAFDNGQLTAFRYPGAMAQPAVYKVIGMQNGMPPAACQNPRSSEAKADLEAREEAVNMRIVNDMVVVDSTYPHWRLRSGEDVLDVYNCGYTIPTAPPSSEVVRRIVAR